MGELDGKVAVITGAGSGMAKASVQAFVREGAKVIAADISGAEKDTAAEVGEGVVPFHCDVTNEADMEAVMRAAVEEFGRLDAVCNVAGIGDAAMVADITMEHYDRVMDIDLRGVVLGTKHGIRTMAPTGGGSIINWSSIGGLGASIGTSVYSVTKGGVIQITRSGAIEAGTKGIRCNAICPGFIETELTGGPGSGKHFPQLIGASALKRPGQPEEVAELACFLASDKASFITGAIIPIDGGTTAKID